LHALGSLDLAAAAARMAPLTDISGLSPTFCVGSPRPGCDGSLLNSLTPAGSHDEIEMAAIVLNDGRGNTAAGGGCVPLLAPPSPFIVHLAYSCVFSSRTTLYLSRFALLNIPYTLQREAARWPSHAGYMRAHRGPPPSTCKNAPHTHTLPALHHAAYAAYL